MNHFKLFIALINYNSWGDSVSLTELHYCVKFVCAVDEQHAG